MSTSHKYPWLPILLVVPIFGWILAAIAGTKGGIRWKNHLVTRW